jgi:hypothetical protein
MRKIATTQMQIRATQPTTAPTIAGVLFGGSFEGAGEEVEVEAEARVPEPVVDGGMVVELERVVVCEVVVRVVCSGVAKGVAELDEVDDGVALVVVKALYCSVLLGLSAHAR